MTEADPYAELDWRANAFEQAYGKRQFPTIARRSPLAIAADRRG